MLMQERQLSMGSSASLIEATSFVFTGIVFCYVATLIYVVLVSQQNGSLC